MTIHEMHRKRVYTGLRALEANAIEERFRAFAPRWLEGIEIEFDGTRDQPQLDRLDIPEPGNCAAAPDDYLSHRQDDTRHTRIHLAIRRRLRFQRSPRATRRQQRNDQLLAKRRYAKRADPRNRCTGAIFIGRI